MLFTKSEPLNRDLPELEEWAVINKRLGEEHEREKELEKIERLEKIKKFRQGLNNQINTKTDVKKSER